MPVKNIRTLSLVIFIFLLKPFSFSQPVEKIKFKKNSSFIYFFQKGIKHDTIAEGRGDLFYLLVPDSIKEFISISVDNASLVKTSNDSLVRLGHLPGLKYETMYTKEIDASKKTRFRFDLQTLINGTSDKEKNVIVIRITNRKEEKPVLENVFYFKTK